MEKKPANHSWVVPSRVGKMKEEKRGQWDEHEQQERETKPTNPKNGKNCILCGTRKNKKHGGGDVCVAIRNNIAKAKKMLARSDGRAHVGWWNVESV
jgi:hypothetical protein